MAEKAKREPPTAERKLREHIAWLEKRKTKLEGAHAEKIGTLDAEIADTQRALDTLK